MCYMFLMEENDNALSSENHYGYKLALRMARLGYCSAVVEYDDANMADLGNAVNIVEGADQLHIKAFDIFASQNEQSAYSIFNGFSDCNCDIGTVVHGVGHGGMLVMEASAFNPSIRAILTWSLFCERSGYSLCNRINHDQYGSINPLRVRHVMGANCEPGVSRPPMHQLSIVSGLTFPRSYYNFDRLDPPPDCEDECNCLSRVQLENSYGAGVYLLNGSNSRFFLSDELNASSALSTFHNSGFWSLSEDISFLVNTSNPSR